ncbi:hypothetical protein M8818_004559 [Zalaria obscura]|uniref:Uncharacterized protein n=1 Tax=Zalaria obscura TaxID=2024903 RepID=A0ACC3SBH0_9PEZI
MAGLNDGLPGCLSPRHGPSRPRIPLPPNGRSLSLAARHCSALAPRSEGTIDCRTARLYHVPSPFPLLASVAAARVARLVRLVAYSPLGLLPSGATFRGSPDSHVLRQGLIGSGRSKGRLGSKGIPQLRQARCTHVSQPASRQSACWGSDLNPLAFNEAIHAPAGGGEYAVWVSRMFHVPRG